MIKKIFWFLVILMIFIGGDYNSSANDSKNSKMTRQEKIEKYKELKARTRFLGSMYNVIKMKNFDATSNSRIRVLVIQIFTFDLESIKPEPSHDHDFIEFFLVDYSEIFFLQGEYNVSFGNILAYGCDGCSEKRDIILAKDGKIDETELIFINSDYSFEIRELFSRYRKAIKEREKLGSLEESIKHYKEEKTIVKQIIKTINSDILIIYKTEREEDGKFWNKIFIGFPSESERDCLKDSKGWNVLEILNIKSSFENENDFLRKNFCSDSSDSDENNKIVLEPNSKFYCGRYYLPCAFPMKKFNDWYWWQDDSNNIIIIFKNNNSSYKFRIRISNNVENVEEVKCLTKN